METVVYWLGAGFSAPLGLPVMSDFLLKAKDQFASGNDEFEYFGEIFQKIDSLSKAKNFFDTDLFNIEEILSLLEMESQLTGSTMSDRYVRFLRDVVDYYTPAVHPHVPLPGNWEDWIWGSDQHQKAFGPFVSSLFNLEISRSRENGTTSGFVAAPMRDANVAYSVISLNYDMVLESYVDHLRAHFSATTEFDPNPDSPIEWRAGAPALVKLHGSVDSGRIVPPTWSKAVAPEISETWARAHELLSTANHIRVLGYSLPESDAYVRYLLKTAALESQNLKSFDVVCVDPDGSVQDRYRRFVTFPYFRFQSRSVVDYFSSTPLAVRLGHKPHTSVRHATLEASHEAFLRWES